MRAEVLSPQGLSRHRESEREEEDEEEEEEGGIVSGLCPAVRML